MREIKRVFGSEGIVLLLYKPPITEEDIADQTMLALSPYNRCTAKLQDGGRGWVLLLDQFEEIKPQLAEVPNESISGEAT